MKSKFALISMLICLLWCQSKASDVAIEHWGRPTNNICVSIGISSAATNGIDFINPVKLNISVKNDSTNCVFEFNLTTHPTDADSLSFVVVDPSGHDITPQLAKFNGNAFGNEILFTHPGEVISRELDLVWLQRVGWLPKFDKFGQYQVTAQIKGAYRHGSNQLEYVTATSSTLTILILQKQ